MTRHHRTIELTWDDEIFALDGVSATLGTERVTGPSIQNVLGRIAEELGFLEPKPPAPRQVGPVEYCCSFCLKATRQVQRMVNTPSGMHVCNECIEAMHRTLTEDVPLPDNGSVRLRGGPRE